MAFTEKAKEARRLYRHEWYMANKDKARLYNERYWEKKASKMEAEALPAVKKTEAEN